MLSKMYMELYRGMAFLQKVFKRLESGIDDTLGETTSICLTHRDE